MKNIYTIIAAMLLAVGMNAQTINVTFEDEPVAQGQTLEIETTAGESSKNYFYLTNTESDPVTVRASYTVLQSNQGDEFLMCLGECTMDTISATYTLQPGVECRNFDIDFTPATNNTTLIQVHLWASDESGALNGELKNFYVKYYNSEVSLPEGVKSQPLSVGIYPNPMAVSAAVDYYVPGKYSDAQMVIRNMVGKTVKVYDLKIGERTKLKINSSDLSNGVYFYSIISNGQTLTTKKLVIRK